MNPDFINRRSLLASTSSTLAWAALSSLLRPIHSNSQEHSEIKIDARYVPHSRPRARRIILLTQAGAPSQVDLFDYKPKLSSLFKTELPPSVRGSQRLTGMTSNQKSWPIAPSPFGFHQHGQSGQWLSELLPYTSQIADELCVIRSLHTEAINHDPAMTYLQTGHQSAGRPALGAWLSYGLGSPNKNLPSFVVMISRPSGPTNAQPLHERMWSSGFLPSVHQGVRFNPGNDPVLFLSNPPGINHSRRRAMLDDLAKLNQTKFKLWKDPEIETRIAQYELAFRMQSEVPELVDLTKEPESTFSRYGPESRKPGTFARHCILARKLAERDVRCIQLYHRGWDHHDKLPEGIRHQCHDTDQPSAALVMDLKERGLLEDTLVVWAGEFGRTVFSQGQLTEKSFGRDHHPRCFSIWMAGGGIARGTSHGETDDFSYNVAQNPVHIHDLNATLLHCFGINHEQLTFPFQGRDFRLTDIHGNVVRSILDS